MKRIIYLLVVVSMALAMFSCQSMHKEIVETTDEIDEANSFISEIESYIITVKSKKGLPLSNAQIVVYGDEELTQIKATAETNNDGIVAVSLTSDTKYFVTVSNVPNGYILSDSYKLDSPQIEIMLDSKLIDKSEVNELLGVGDIMYDFSFDIESGETITLSQLLKTNEIVIMEWYGGLTGHSQVQFYNMSKVYEDYKNDIEIIACLNDQSDIPFLKTANFPYWQIPLEGYPTSIYIDKNGVIVAVELGSTEVSRIEKIIKDNISTN